MGLELLLEGEDGSRVQLSSEAAFGRYSPGFNSTDRTVSRRHVAFQLDQPGNRTVPDKVSFQVIGKNPIWVRSGSQVGVFRKSENGEVGDGDRLCVSGLHPVWFRLRVVEPGDGDVSWVDVDPVKEFGFLVIGHEFDGYRKGRRIREAKDWNWFLEENGEVSGEEGRSGGRKGGKLGKRRKGGGGEEEDEDWTGESEEDKEVVSKSRKVGKRKMYVTRSKDGSRGGKGKGNEKMMKGKGKDVASYDDEDEDDETLGGFIVDEDEVEEGDNANDEEEEEEFVDDDEEED